MKTTLDEIDRWLADSFGIIPGCCSSTDSLRYSVARRVAEALWPKEHFRESTKMISEDLDAEIIDWAGKFNPEIREYIESTARHFANWQKERFVKLLDQWEEHAIRGMKKGAVAYHQGKVALIIDLKDSLKDDEK